MRGADVNRAREDEPWDVVIIGAGPAGAMAAYLAAKRGLRTLLLDRRRFPRYKVCGGCVNQRGVAILRHWGLGGALESAGRLDRASLETLAIQHPRGCLRIPLPGGVVVDRGVFDQALVNASVQAGATFVDGTLAQVERPEDGPGDYRRVRLQGGDEARSVLARVCLVATGLGTAGPGEPRLRSPGAKSRLGLAASLVGTDGDVEAGEIRMAVGRAGYVGRVGLGGQLLVAAAVDHKFLRTSKTPGLAINGILQQAGDGWSAAAANWRGTTPLWQRPSRVAGWRMLLVGDACGYVEPFTGEGIANALATGVAAVELVDRGWAGWDARLEEDWARVVHRLVYRRAIWCRSLARLSRHPWATGVALRFLGRFPWMAEAVVRHLNAPGLIAEVN